MYLGVDQSKRSTGLVLLDTEGNLKDFRLICPSMTLDGIELVRYKVKEYSSFLFAHNLHLVPPKVALIEGLSFGAIGGAKDILAGLNWIFRFVSAEYYNFFLGTVPVSQWRSKILTKEEQKEAKSLGKDGLKKKVVEKLPVEVRNEFQEYVKLKGFKKESLYDLADAYCIALYAKEHVIESGTKVAKKSIDK